MNDAHGPRAPRSSAQVMRRAMDDHLRQRKSRALRRAILGALVLVGLVYGANAYLVARPAAAALAADTSYAGIDLRARLHYFLDPTTLVLDLRRTGAAPEDAFRALAQVAGALQTEERSFERVLLTHRNHAVYILSGADFAHFGTKVVAGRPPSVVARDIPVRLRGPAGSGGVGLWAPPAGAPLGLLFTDAARAATRWASGGR